MRCYHASDLMLHTKLLRVLLYNILKMNTDTRTWVYKTEAIHLYERYAPCVKFISAIVVAIVGRFSLDLPETFLYSIAWGSSLARKIL